MEIFKLFSLAIFFEYKNYALDSAFRHDVNTGCRELQYPKGA